MTLRAAVYCRISDDREGRAVGVKTQEEDCRKLAAGRGWDVVDVFVDNDRSAWVRNRKRPGWDRLMEGLASKSYDAVVVFHGDRLMRQPRDLEDMLDLADRGVQLASPTGERNLSDPDDRFILRIEVAHACRSSDDTSRRTKRGHARLAQEGRRSGGGHRPYGMSCNGTPGCDLDGCAHDGTSLVLAEAAVIRDAAAAILNGRTMRGVAAELNAKGVPTVSGKPWRQQVLRRIVTAGHTCGWREHHGVLVAEGDWPAILDRATVERLRSLLHDPARRTSSNPRRYLLTGLLMCGRPGCGAKLVARPVADKRPAYQCAKGPGFHGCGGMKTLAEPIELLVRDAVMLMLDSDAFADALTERPADDNEAAAMAEVEACEAKLNELAADWAADLITRPEWLAARQAIDARLDAARRRLVTIAQPAAARLAGQGKTITGRWDRMTFDEQRATVASVVEHVTLASAVKGRNYFDPDRVTITWAF